MVENCCSVLDVAPTITEFTRPDFWLRESHIKPATSLKSTSMPPGELYTPVAGCVEYQSRGTQHLHWHAEVNICGAESLGVQYVKKYIRKALPISI